MSQCRTILHNQDVFSGNRARVLYRNRHSGFDDGSLRIENSDIAANELNSFPPGRVYLAYDDHVGHANVGFTRMIGQLVPSAVWISQHDDQIGTVERKIVVS